MLGAESSAICARRRWALTAGWVWQGAATGMCLWFWVCWDMDDSATPWSQTQPTQYAQDAGIACAGGTTPCDTFTTRFSPRDTFATLSTNVGGTGPPLVGGMITGPLDISDDVERERPLNSSRVVRWGVVACDATTMCTPHPHTTLHRVLKTMWASLVHLLVWSRVIMEQMHSGSDVNRWQVLCASTQCVVHAGHCERG